jgi:quercetin dioxygenase-like cupin family protein
METHERPARDEIIVLASSQETQGRLFRFEYVARTVSAPPANHVHDRQEERVEVLAGTVSCRIHDKEHLLGPGESRIFPIGVPHAVWSADPNGSRAIGQFEPALDTQEQFEAIMNVS